MATKERKTTGPLAPGHQAHINRRQIAKAKTIDLLAEKAKELFDTLGYEATTIRLIADKAGMSTGAIFANWTDKEALWRYVKKCPPPVGDCALHRAAAGMLSVLEGLQQADDADKAMGYPCMAAVRRDAIDAAVNAAKTPLPFEVKHV